MACLDAAPEDRLDSARSRQQASVTGVAPCLSNPLVPSQRGSSGEPGTAKTSRPCSPAMPGGDQGARAPARFDDDDAELKDRGSGGFGAESRGRAAPRRAAFPKQRRRRHESLEQVNVLGRIDTVVAAGKNGDRAGCRQPRCAAASMPRARPDDDRESRITEIARHSIGNSCRRAGSIAEPTMAICGSREDVGFSTRRRQRRRVVNHLQARRIVRLAQSQRIRRLRTDAAYSSRRGLFARARCAARALTHRGVPGRESIDSAA